MSDGPRNRIKFSGDRYRDYGMVNPDGTVGEPTDLLIVQKKVRSPRDWRILLQWPPLPDAPDGPLEFSEVVMAGDLLIWSNWQGTSVDVMHRVSVSVSRIARDSNSAGRP